MDMAILVRMAFYLLGPVLAMGGFAEWNPDTGTLTVTVSSMTAAATAVVAGGGIFALFGKK
ncbi:MAG: hypothetical protein HRT62_10000 [Epibacterium sp.]|nr:hypothetical protein [Epibacterium sp.]